MKKTTRKNSKKRSRKLKKTVKRLAAYSAAAAATVVTSGSTANAQEVVWDVPDLAITGPGYLFNLVTGSYNVAPVTDPSGYPIYNSTQGVFRFGSFYPRTGGGIYGPANSTFAGLVGTPGFISYFSASPGGYVYASKLAASSPIGPDNDWAGATAFSSYGNYAWLDNLDGGGIVGLRFKIGMGTRYGWARVTGSGADMKLTAFGYNQSRNTPSHPVPEPSSVMLLAAGAAGLAGWRRRRAA